MFYVYKFQNKVNGKVYIGKTDDLAKRYADHKYAYGSAPLFHNAIKKYGIDGFNFEVIGEFESEEEAFKSEIHFIALHKSNKNRYGSDFGYNLTDGGEGPSGNVHSEEFKMHLSKLNSGSGNPFYGRKHSKETKDKLSAKKKGQPNFKKRGQKLSDETKTKISVANTGNKYCLGRTLPEETRSKIASSLMGKMAGEAHPFWGKKRPKSVGEKISQAKKGKSTMPPKVSDDVVSEIRLVHQEKSLTYAKLAQLFNVSITTIGRIIRYESPYGKGKQ